VHGRLPLGARRIFAPYFYTLMTLSYRWLLEYLPEPIAPEELSRILTSIGLEVEGTEEIGGVKGGLEGLRIGQVLTCAPHPNADKLKLTTVSFGDGAEVLQIVCGAPNVAAGEKVIVATVGTTMHPVKGEPFTIKKAKIRGEESVGMLCSAAEIGLSDDASGLLLLPADAPLGVPASEYFAQPEQDIIIHVGLTPNRSDAASHIGSARDVCAYLSHHVKATSLQLPDVRLPDATGQKSPISVSIEAKDACPRYAGLTLQGIKVAPSPDWLQQRLRAIAVRPVNNVVDATNYVLHEWGQPLHAFDASKIRGGEVIVKFLPDATAFKTLDGTERRLKGSDLMICDQEGGLCIAGVFGGIESGITESTTSVFLESAYFDPTTIRRTSLHHDLRTDAATHFEKGVDIEAVVPALQRAAALILQLAGGEIVGDLIDLYQTPVTPVLVATTYGAIDRLAGKTYSPNAVETILTSLGFTFAENTKEGFTVQVPTAKRDILQAADIVEEILRIDGLDNVSVPRRLSYALTQPRKSDRSQRGRVSDLLCNQGFQEILTNSIVNSKWYADQSILVRMINSLSSELDVMRPSLLESGLEVIQHNVNRKAADLCLFEIGSVYSTAAGSNKYEETPHVALFMTGNVRSGTWQEKAKPADLFAINGVVENLLKAFAIQATATSSEGVATWQWNGRNMVTASAVPADRLKLFGIKEAVFYADVDWKLFVEAAAQVKVQYSEIPRFPSVQRDLALILNTSVRYEEVSGVTKRLSLPELQSFSLFDVFENEKLGTDKKSYALSYTFQVTDRTPTDTEIDQWMQKLIGAYRKELGAEIRS
jgi:phenylalanyl-tRNA synthetase beta chain